MTAMPDPESTQFWVSNEDEPIPPVDPEDLKRRWNTRKQRLTCEAAQAAQSQEADRVAVAHRFRMISMLAEAFNKGQLLAPWKHGEELDDVVFRIAGSFPIWPLRQHVYKVPGDSLEGFDPNAFVQKLVEETGFSHTWEPVLARIPEGEWSYTKWSAGTPDSEREARCEARELLWAVWSKCQPNLGRPSPKIHVGHNVAIVAMVFADFAIDNIGLALEVVSFTNVAEGRPPLAILADLERKARRTFSR